MGIPASGNSPQATTGAEAGKEARQSGRKARNQSPPRCLQWPETSSSSGSAAKRMAGRIRPNRGYCSCYPHRWMPSGQVLSRIVTKESRGRLLGFGSGVETEYLSQVRRSLRRNRCGPFFQRLKDRCRERDCWRPNTPPAPDSRCRKSTPAPGRLWNKQNSWYDYATVQT